LLTIRAEFCKTDFSLFSSAKPVTQNLTHQVAVKKQKALQAIRL
jgi:hypothetical protein